MELLCTQTELDRWATFTVIFRYASRKIFNPEILFFRRIFKYYCTVLNEVGECVRSRVRGVFRSVLTLHVATVLGDTDDAFGIYRTVLGTWGGGLFAE